MDEDLGDLAEYIGMTMEARTLPQQANEKISEPAPVVPAGEPPLVTEFAEAWAAEFGDTP